MDKLMTTSSEGWFDRARTLAAHGNLVVVRADGQFLILPALPMSSARPGIVEAVESLIPSTTKRNVAAVGDSSWATPISREGQY